MLARTTRTRTLRTQTLTHDTQLRNNYPPHTPPTNPLPIIPLPTYTIFVILYSKKRANILSESRKLTLARFILNELPNPKPASQHRLSRRSRFVLRICCPCSGAGMIGIWLLLLCSYVACHACGSLCDNFYDRLMID